MDLGDILENSLTWWQLNVSPYLTAFLVIPLLELCGWYMILTTAKAMQTAIDAKSEWSKCMATIALYFFLFLTFGAFVPPLLLAALVSKGQDAGVALVLAFGPLVVIGISWYFSKPPEARDLIKDRT